eukprot:m.126257 g.126257  ORF g.126257 m.126257 type:complete len:90 (+) comp13565_c0_seq5:1686-1955(+)
MRAVIVGGGIAGASIARVLSRRGVDVTLLEKSGQLCSGATWHAAGLVTRFAGSSKLKKIHVSRPFTSPIWRGATAWTLLSLRYRWVGGL